MKPLGRLAPTPSGELHLGNITAFAAAWLSVRSAGGELVLRVEDVDRGRARREVEDGQRRDLEWLGLSWDHEVAPQRDRDYLPWLERLSEQTYRCTCTRKMIRDSGGTYTGTCRAAGHTEGVVRFRLPDASISYTDRRWGQRTVDLRRFGDPVLRRRDKVFAYNLAVVADDIADGVSEVVRGADLLDYAAVQTVLWQTLGATPPTWLHAPLVLGPDGTKLAKRHASTSIADLRTAGWSARDVWRVVLPWLGLDGDDLDHAARHWRPDRGPLGPVQLLEAPTRPGIARWEPAPMLTSR